MLDKLSLTVDREPDKSFIERLGEVTEDIHRTKLYKFICQFGNMTIMFCPHKFSDRINAKIAFTKIDTNPKYYPYCRNMVEDLSLIFDDHNLDLSEFNVSRVDIASDIEDLDTFFLLSILYVHRIRSESLNLHKGTIYYGSNPRGRIYNKDKEIRDSLKRGEEITNYERRILESGKQWVRFEIMKRHPKLSLEGLAADPIRLVALYDSLQFIEPNSEGLGILQFQLKYINRKFRDGLKRFQDTELIRKIKDGYIKNVADWFYEKEPF